MSTTKIHVEYSGTLNISKDGAIEGAIGKDPIFGFSSGRPIRFMKFAFDSTSSAEDALKRLEEAGISGVRACFDADVR